MPEIKINNRLIGEDHPPIVIAEMGINHEGSIDLAIAMADSAIEAGAEIIKHQTHIVEDEMSDEAKSVIPGNADVSIYEIMDRCALDEKEEFKLMREQMDLFKDCKSPCMVFAEVTNSVQGDPKTPLSKKLIE